MTVLVYTLSFVVLLLNLSLFIRLKPPYNFYLVGFCLLAAALSPILAILGLLGAALGGITDAPAAAAAGLVGSGISLYIIVCAFTSHTGFDRAFGAGWQGRIAPVQAARLLNRRWAPGLPKTPEPVFERDRIFWRFPETGRELLCDLWQPASSGHRSGLAVVYFHGSAWYALDKDLGTRPLFRRLTAQGHVVMDVAYRLCPEVDIFGMVGDVKRALAWMKDNAARLGVNPRRIVLGGGSAGGHLALLAAYTWDNDRLNPPDLAGRDLTARGVFSTYGPTDLLACYHHLGQERLVGKPRPEIGLPGAATMKKNVADGGRVDLLLGGHPSEAPEMYTLGSPVTHVRAGCPPTLLIQGKGDVIAPVSATRELHRRLEACGVPAVNIVYPLANHAFDLILPHISPLSQSAMYDLERFLALLV